MTPQQQIYNPYRLIEEVTELLRDRGLDPTSLPATPATPSAAPAWSSAPSASPLMEAEDAFQMSAAKVWSKEDGLIQL